MINLNQFGKLCYTVNYGYNMNNNLIALLYNNKDTKTSIMTEANLGNNIFGLSIKKDNVIYPARIYNLNRPLKELLNNYTEQPLLLGARNGIIKDEDNEETYSINFKNINGLDIDMEFDSRTMISFEKGMNKCNVYGIKDDIIDPSLLYETYYFTNNGFYSENKQCNKAYCLTEKFKGVYKYDLEISDNNSPLFLSKKATNIKFDGELNKDLSIKCKYDKYGLMNSCKTSISELEFCKLEYETNFACSIHLLSYDPFDIEYITAPFSYWCQDKYIVHDNAKTIIREVYKLDNDGMEKLLEELNNK